MPGHALKAQPKIWRFNTIGHKDEGTLIGVSSSVVGAANRLMLWMIDGADPEELKDSKPEDFEIISVHPNGTISYYNDSLDPTIILAGTIFAIGSGSAYALGAMQAGASATDAVAIASMFDNFSGQGVDTLAHKG